MRLAIALLAVLLISWPAAAQSGYDTLSPFEAVRWEAGQPAVMVRGQWYTLVSIDSLTREQLVRHASDRFGDLAVKRFEEDLVQIMSELGTPPGKTVRLVLRAEDGQEVVLPAVEMSHENRQNIRRAGAQRAVTSAANDLTRERAAAALDDLAKLLTERHSYAAMGNSAWRDAIESAKGRLPASISRRDFAAALAEIISPIGDGHSGVEAPGFPDSEPYLPFLPVGFGTGDSTRIVAVKPDRSGLLDPAHPYVISIDGLPIAKWLDACAVLVPRGSPQYILDRSCRQLRSIGLLRSRVGVADSQAVTVELADRDGASRVAVRLGVAADKPIFGAWPQTKTHILDGGIGYLRLADMGDGDAFRAALTGELESLRTTPGLIIDVRGNGGGSREAIQVVGDFLLGAGATPIVYNASRPLNLPGESRRQRAERMATRFLYQAADPNWSDAEHAAIESFTTAFKPEVALPDDRFGPWFYAVLSPSPAAGAPFTGKVAVLLDPVCFSATDVFLAALKEIPGVTLFGTPSAGGSGLAEDYQIGGGAARVRLSTMVSFQPGGQLFEGRGVAPDILVEPAPEDLITFGGDTVLDAAIRALQSDDK